MPALIPHGTLDYGEIAKWGYRPEDLLVFSSNINPYGPPPSVVQTVADHIDAATLALYPDRLSLDLRRVLAENDGVPEEAIIVGNGTADIMWLLAIVYLRDRRVTVCSPTFGEYGNAANVVGTDIHAVAFPGWQRKSDATYGPADTTIEQVAASISASNPDVVFICNPNSPTGEHLTPEQLESLMDGAQDALWIIDEAYYAFTPAPWSAAEWTQYRNLIVLRSMTKDFSLGGLRLGYAIAHPDKVAEMNNYQPPWNVNALAQIAGAGCMQEIEWRDETLAMLRQETANLRMELKKLGYEPHPTTANYFIVPIENPAAFRESLLRHRIVIRDCTSFGLPDYIRIATQTPEHNQVLLETMEKLRDEAEG